MQPIAIDEPQYNVLVTLFTKRFLSFGVVVRVNFKYIGNHLYDNILVFRKKSCEYCGFRARTGLKLKVWANYIL